MSGKQFWVIGQNVLMANPKKQAGNESDLYDSDHTIASPHVKMESSNLAHSSMALYSLEILLLKK